MCCVARSHFVNRTPGGETLSLTPRQLYDGLKIKARNPRDFVPLIEHCEVKSESNTGLLREIRFKGKMELVQERVEFFEPMTANFTMLSPDGDIVGRVTNVISTTPDGEVLLTFTFAIGQNGQEHDEAADEHAKRIVGEADTAIEQTIKTVRNLVKEGKL